ncbi:MAG: hypothetical protein R3281_14530 [Balneolaceae bacterium]|nr:hypothetical protein [Balneolaceae bacterium]
MESKFKSLKEQLRSLEESDIGSGQLQRKKSSSTGGTSLSTLSRYVLFGAFLIAFLFYAGARYGASELQAVNPVEQFFSWVNQPDQQLLEDMGDWMEEMGYTNLTREDLIELREEGVTATFTSRMRDLGYTDLTLEELVRLRQNDVSATFSAMMRELGYDLSIEELIRLRQHGVTAYFTSNMHDLGYTEITTDELIRLRDTGVRPSEVERLIEESETLPTIEELIRYHISNQ